MKIFKKTLCLLLCLSMLFGGLALFSTAHGAVANAASVKTCNCDNIPLVSLSGIGDTLYMNYGTEEQTSVGVVNTDGITDQILPMITNVLAAVATLNWDKGADALATLANGMFGHLQLDEKGKSIQPVSNPARFNPEQNHKENREYHYHYDWRLDPMESAAGLNKFIKQVLASTGHKKVLLTSHSEGGLICAAYLAQFGSGSIEHYVPLFSAHNGLTMLGELFTGKVKLDANQVLSYLRTFGASSDEGFIALLGPLANTLELSGLAQPLVNAVALLLDNVKDKVYKDTLIPLFGQWPALWGFVPDEYYEPAKAFMLNDPKYTEFKKIIDNFHYKAGPGMADKLLVKAAKTTKISIVAAYGFSPIPVMAKSYETDGLIDSARESSGATFAPIGQTFPANYKQAVKGHNHISPDRRVDASTCILPDQTWFIKNHPHFNFEHSALHAFLLNSKKQPTVFTSKEFPQFITRLPDGTFVPTTAEEPAPEVTLASSTKELLSGGWKLIVDSIKK